MNKSIMKLLNSNKLVVNQYLIKVSNQNKLSLVEFLILVYIDNDITKNFDIDKMSEILFIDQNMLMEAFNSLMIKGLIKMDSVKDESLSMITEKLSINPVYEQIIDDIEQEQKVDEKDDIYKIFEREIGRTLSTMELEIISGWIQLGVSEELILGALKEAVYNGVTNFRYIDKIIYEWNKKGFQTMDDVKKHLESRREQKSKDKVVSKREQEIADFDWLDGV